MRPRAFAAAVLLLLLTATVPSAEAIVDPNATATDQLAAMSLPGALGVASASFLTTPAVGATGVSDSPLTQFPTDGDTFTVLTTGGATLAATPNQGGAEGLNLAGPNERGNTDYDVTILQIDFTTPVGGDCLSFDFQFLSDEFPEYVGSSFNDAFIAELDSTTWTTSGSSISAPNNFAFDANGDVISINAAGIAGMSADESVGTTYDGATPLLRTKTPVGPGDHTLYLSIFDQGDSVLDSAVFIDNMAIGTAGAEGCDTGVILPSAPVAIADASPVSVLPGEPVTFDGSASYDPDEGDVLSYSWSNGETSASFVTSFDQPGSYCVTLTVTDLTALSDSDDACVEVVNLDPVSVPSVDDDLVNLGQTATFDGSASYDPEDGPVSSYEWYDDTGALVSTAATFAHAFAETGTQCLTLVVFDSFGATDSAASCLDVSDELIVTIKTDKNTYALVDDVKLTVTAHYLDGTPAAGARLAAYVDYESGIHNRVDQVIVQIGCAPWSKSGFANDEGKRTFTMDGAVLAHCLNLGGPGVVHLPTDLGGAYRARGTGSIDGNSGADTTTFRASLLGTLGF